MRHYNIPVFVPHKGCPHDCVFCNQRRITGTNEEVTYETVVRIVDEYLKSFKEQNRKVEIAFFGGSFTAIPMDMQTELLSAAFEYIKDGRVDGIRLSTRPDAIDYEILDNLKRYGVTTIELGVQSMDAEVLRLTNRGYEPEVVAESVRKIKEYNCFSLGLQMMTGLPGDTDEKSLYTCDCICSMAPDFVRIYPTLVVKDTALADMFEQGVYKPQELDDAVLLCAKLKQKFLENNIDVIRVSLQTTEEISPDASVIGGPFHSAFGELVDNALFYEKMEKLISDKNIAAAKLAVNKCEISKAVGNGKINIKKMLERHGIRIYIYGDEGVPKGQIRLSEVIENCY